MSPFLSPYCFSSYTLLLHLIPISSRLLDAGPLVLIVTALVTIFTVGLGERADGELSAYSVFNRGFQRLMGSVDVEALVNQHVGGGMMMGGGMPEPMGDGPPEENRGAGRRGNNHQQHNNARLNDNNVARREGANDEGEQSDDDDDDNNIDRNNGQQRQQARRSGKKARRRNQEERQDQRRQREVARAMGLDGTGGQEEAMAMQRLIEEQIANNHDQE